MKLHFNLCTVLLLYYLNLTAVIVIVHSLSPDGLSLLSLKSAISSPTGFPDWNDSDATPCHWPGVSCENITTDSEPRVVGLSLAGKHLNGYIPSELGNLIYLRRLNLHDNNFQGSLPSQLFNATSLHSIFLYNNNFSGPLPSSLCNLPRLQNLDLSRNSFSDSIPHFLINCKQMQRLILAGNQFSGSIPKGIWSQLTNLIQLDLSSNHLNGSIPEDLGELQSLSGTLNLSFNHLSGQIPNTLGDLPMTVSFDLRHNNLSGEIPQSGSFASQGPTAFLNNPLLCGFPLQQNCNATSTDPSDSTHDAPSEGSDRNSNDRQDGRGLKSSTIILISVLDAVVVAVVGLIIVYIYWKKFDDSNTCSCTGTKKLGGHSNNHGNGGKLCVCFTGFGSNDSDVDSEKSGGGYGGGGSSSAGGRASGEGELVAIDKGFSFELDELLRASAYVLGKSGLGIVYKVVLGNGIPVAVRRLGEGGEQRYKEFAAEIQAIGKVKHPNVVKLRAYYWAPDEKLLISDFINNGNLATALRGRGGQPSSNLPWTIRLKIAKGTARGLAYLHECSPRKYVHGDIKPSNILLDNDFQPYVSDFGLNRLITITGSNNDPSSSGGGSGGFMGGALPYIKSIHQEKSNTYYRAPEARIPGTRPTQKWDIYSFGIVLFELLTGKNPENPSSFSPTTVASSSNSFASNMEIQQDLVKWVRKGFEQESPLCDMVDPILLQEVHTKKEVLAVFHVALACTEGDPEIRPRMKTVSENLEKIGT